MDDSQNASANAPRRIFAGIGESKRLLAPEPKPRDEPADPKPEHAGRERADDGEYPEQEQVELIDRLAPPTVAELALAGGADKHAEHGCAADPAGLGGGREFGRHHVGNERAQHNQIDHVEEISSRNEPDHLDVERGDLCLVQ